MSEEGATDPPPEDAAAEGEEGEKPEGEEGGEEGEKGIAERIVTDPIELGFLVPLPIELKFDNIPRINDSRSVWR